MKYTYNLHRICSTRIRRINKRLNKGVNERTNQGINARFNERIDGRIFFNLESQVHKKPALYICTLNTHSSAQIHIAHTLTGVHHPQVASPQKNETKKRKKKRFPA